MTDTAFDTPAIDRSAMKVSDEVAIDIVNMNKWFGTFHDGSLEAHQAMKSRRRASTEADMT